MKQDLIKDIIQGMLPYLNNAQVEKMQEVLQYTFIRYEVTENKQRESNLKQNYVELFLAAKRIEGCSEKTLKYYKTTIEMMTTTVAKSVKYIETNDIRRYLTEYQENKNSSKITIDNIRRILSSFFSWLEDEDYILKSPVRRIHKIKTATNIKETYSDEALELMRDNCIELRDLAMIDMLASTGMRVGDDDDKIRLNQRKPSKYKGLRRFGPEKNLQRINKFMKERPIFYKNLIQMKENIRFYLRCFYCITKVMILQFNSENRTELARNG